MTTLTRQYVKRCDLADFDDPELLEAIHGLIPERDPKAFAERKTWEYAQLLLFMRDIGALNDSTQALGIGAGDERPLFWLANKVGRVVATDIYGDGRFADQEGAGTMLTDPASHAPFPYREDHLEVRWMDARELEFDDDTFDVAFSLSSIEHFGSMEEISKAMREMARVIRPGGHAFVTTELLIERRRFRSMRGAARASLGIALGLRRRATLFERRGADVFTLPELYRSVVNAGGLELMQAPDLSISPESFDNVALFDQHETMLPKSGAQWPHIVLSTRGWVYTSVALAFQKPG